MVLSTDVLLKGKRIPNWTVELPGGEKQVLWDYRQKSHLVLIYDPDQNAETVKRWLAAIQADHRQWDWLNVKMLIVAKAPEDMTPGVYAVDRYGILLNQYPLNSWTFDDLEREFLYYEAHHC